MRASSPFEEYSDDQPMSEDCEKRAAEFREAFEGLLSEMEKFLVGQGEIIRSVLAAFFVEGHALLEGAPGLERRPSSAPWRPPPVCGFQGSNSRPI